MSTLVELRKPTQSVTLERTQATRETRSNWLRWITDPEVRQWMADDLPEHPDEVYRWVELATTDPRRHYFDIRVDGKPVGFINLREDQSPDNTGEIGIVIGETAYHGRGIGTKALSDMLDYAQDTLQLTSVRALIKPDNIKSLTLFLNAGFSYTHDVTVNGVTMLHFQKTLNE